MLLLAVIKSSAPFAHAAINFILELALSLWATLPQPPPTAQLQRREERGGERGWRFRSTVAPNGRVISAPKDMGIGKLPDFWYPGELCSWDVTFPSKICYLFEKDLDEPIASE